MKREVTRVKYTFEIEEFLKKLGIEEKTLDKVEITEENYSHKRHIVVRVMA